MGEICFVIQPFDNGKFDKRYKEIIKPAVIESGFESYRVDEDYSSVILIESIHNMIKKSSVCIAEITTDNPNVWYELGYALACSKRVIMLCSDERTTPFPFDIRHRNILTYQTQCGSDFSDLGEKLHERLKSDTSSKDKYEGKNDINEYELVVLQTIWENQNTPFELTPKNSIVKSDSNKKQIINALRKLTDERLIEFVYSCEDNIMRNYYRLTNLGENWIKNKLS